MRDEGSFDSSSLKTFQNKSEVGCFFLYAIFSNVVKRLKSKTTLVFWIFLVVACGFMESFKDMAMNKFKKPSIFSG